MKCLKTFESSNGPFMDFQNFEYDYAYAMGCCNLDTFWKLWKAVEGSDERFMDSQNFEYDYDCAMECCNFRYVFENYRKPLKTLEVLMNVSRICKFVNIIMLIQCNDATLDNFWKGLKVLMDVSWILKHLNTMMSIQ